MRPCEDLWCGALSVPVADSGRSTCMIREEKDIHFGSNAGRREIQNLAKGACSARLLCCRAVRVFQSYCCVARSCPH